MSLHNALHEVQNTVEAFQWKFFDHPEMSLTDELVGMCVEAGLYSLANDDFDDTHNTRQVILGIAENTAEAIESGLIVIGSELANPKFRTNGDCIRATGDQITVGLIASHDWLDLALAPEDTRKNVRAIATLLGAASVADYHIAPDTYEDHTSHITLPDQNISDAALKDFGKTLPGIITSRAGYLERFVMVAGMKAANNEQDLSN